MGIYKRILINEFKSKFSFRLNYIVSVAFSFLYISLQVNIWKALYTSNNVSELNNINLMEMISYSIIATMTQKIVFSNVMYDINNMVIDGSISLQLLLPTNFRLHQFLISVSENVFWAIYGTIPPVLMAVLLYGMKFDYTVSRILLFLFSVMLAILIGFLISFMMGSTVIWLRNSFFLSNINSVFLSLFAGANVPLWFFPSWLNLISKFLPFRYMVYEPISILMGKTDQYISVFIMQIFWIFVLYVVSSYMWNLGQKKIFVQGG